jgi:hypothetical protein
MPLVLDSAYLYESIDLLAGFLTGLAFQVWLKLRPELEVTLAGIISNSIHDLARDGCYRYSEQLSRLVEAHHQTLETVALAKVNRLLATQARLGPEAVAEEALNWDTAALADVYALARLILLRDDTNAKELFRRVRLASEVTNAEVRSWLIFRRWRDDGTLNGVDLA